MRAGAVAVAVALLVPVAHGTAQGVPGDSTLAAACASGGGLADGLLVVQFRPDVTAARRAAMAQEAGARLAGGAPGAGPDAYYITLPSDSRALLDATADRLIRLDGVESVGGLACPPPPPAPVDSAAADTSAADTSAADTSAAPPPAESNDAIRAADSAAAP